MAAAASSWVNDPNKMPEEIPLSSLKQYDRHFIWIIHPAAAITNYLDTEAEAAITKYSDPFTVGEKIKIADGSHGAHIWEVKATLDSKHFALKSIPEEKRAMTEFAAYRRFEDQSIIRCYSCKKGDYSYELLLEKGECTLHEFIKVCKGNSPTHQNANRQNFLIWAEQYVKLWNPFLDRQEIHYLV